MFRVLKTEDWFHADGFPISVQRRDPQEPFGLHAHQFVELVIITGGRGLHVTGKESWPLAASDVFVISGSRPHDYRNMDQLRLVNILYQPQRLNLELNDLTTHFAMPVNLDELARMAHMSKRSFIRAFRAATDQTPIAYLIQLRINRAAMLLRQAQDNITDIAFRVGFSDSNYFTRQFRKLLGVSPRGYRQQHGVTG